MGRALGKDGQKQSPSEESSDPRVRAWLECGGVGTLRPRRPSCGRDTAASPGQERPRGSSQSLTPVVGPEWIQKPATPAHLEETGDERHSDASTVGAALGVRAALQRPSKAALQSRLRPYWRGGPRVVTAPEKEVKPRLRNDSRQKQAEAARLAKDAREEPFRRLSRGRHRQGPQAHQATRGTARGPRTVAETGRGRGRFGT
ncbi:uncharacterized protein [Symphalangus syndactylus]|uniref:uncharacterized protein n=1 Tax=Symphalangus syndactylus TaxID=9590 RepID=UPI00300581DF